LRDFDATKREILDRVSLLEVVSQHVELKQRGGSHGGGRYVGLCPFHSEKTPSFNVSPEKGFFKCFGCGKGGDLFTFVQWIDHVSFGEALRMLADRAGVDLGRHNNPASSLAKGGLNGDSVQPSRTDLAKVNEWACGYFRKQLLNSNAARHAREYVRSRGIGKEIEDRFEIGFAGEDVTEFTRCAGQAGWNAALLTAADLLREGDDGHRYATFRNRLMFPIRDAMNRVVGFGGRTLGEDRAKYLNTRQTPLFEKGKGLYGIVQARRRIGEVKRAVVVEGYTDCIIAHQAGFGETLATLGTALTTMQVDLIRRYAGTCVFMFDADEAGERAADRAITVAMPRYLTVKLAQIPEGKDPADFLQSHRPEEFAAMLDSACDALQFKWDRMLQRFDGSNDARSRHNAVTEFIGIVASACDSAVLDPIGRGLIVNKMAGLLSVETVEIHRLIRQSCSSRSHGQLDHDQGKAEVNSENQQDRPDSDQSNLVRILEVLLNEPGLWSMARDDFEPDRFDSARDGRIAAVVVELAGQYGEFDLSEVMARCENPLDTQRVVELAQRGADRGNYERTLTVALEGVRQVRAARQVATLRGSVIRELNSQSMETPAKTEATDSYFAGVKQHHHFAGARLIGRGANYTGSTGESESSPEKVK